MVALDQPDAAAVRPTELPCALGHGVQHWLHVGRRLADDAQDLGGRRLSLERLFGLVEQAAVLDRDHCLVGEGPEQHLLLVAERTRWLAENADGADPRSFPDQRTVDRRKFALVLNELAHARLGNSDHGAVGDLYRAALTNRLSREGRFHRHRADVAHQRVERRTAPRRRMHVTIVAQQHDRELVARKQVMAAVENLLEHRRCVRH